jgi:cyclophilin family peptidyl-prolyl cis-trans isomerase
MMKRFVMMGLLGLLCAAGTACAQANNPVVVIDTSMGQIKVELFQSKAPITVKNILRYVDEKFYDGTVFHRVIPDFMIQGGGMGSADSGGKKVLKEKETHAPIKNESGNGLANTRGTLAMARTNEPDSATAQFFINVKNNDFLDKANARDGVGYAVFGRVIEGMDVVDKIRQVETGNRGPHENVPVQDVVIKSIRRSDSK